MVRRLAWIGLALVPVLLIVIFANYFYQQSLWHGSLIKPPIPAPPINLTTADGQPFRLDDYHGKVVLLFFGYTNCVDICPATMNELSSARKLLNSDQAARVQVVYVTVDPQRDSPQVVKDFTARFDPTFIGLSGTEAALSTVWKSYGVYREIQPAAGDGYMVAHTSRVYVIYPNGELSLSFSFGTSPENVAKDVRRILREYK